MRREGLRATSPSCRCCCAADITQVSGRYRKNRFDRSSSLLNGREQPIAPMRTHEGPQFSDLARLTAFDGPSTRALDHAVLERKVHGYGRIIGVAFAPGFCQIASQQFHVSDAIDQPPTCIARQLL